MKEFTLKNFIGLLFVLLVSIGYVHAQLDADNDGIADNIDLDDDNDGILDVDELFCAASELIWGNSWSVGQDPTIDAPASVTVNGVVVTSNKSKTGDAINVGVDVGSRNGVTGLDLNGQIDELNSGTFTYQVNFSKPLYNLTFSIVDIDQDVAPFGYGEYTDRVQLIASINGITVPLTAGIDYTVGADVADMGGGIFQGNADLVNGGVTANVNFTIKTLVDEIQIVYTNVKTTELHSPMFILLSDMSWSCSALDTDNDGIYNYLDLDSDNDDCFDALEANANLTYSDINAGAINAPVGLVTDTYPGVPNNTPATNIGTSQNINQQAEECDGCNINSSLAVDTDADGITNKCDLDDDNDGILDTEECSLISENLDWSNSTWPLLSTTHTDNTGSIPFDFDISFNGTFAPGSPSVLDFYQGDQPSVDHALIIGGNGTDLITEDIKLTIDVGTVGLGGENVSFKLFDLDGNNTPVTGRNYIERAVIQGYLNGVQVLPSITGTSIHTVIGNLVYANTDTPITGSGSESGVVKVAFLEAVDKIVISFNIIDKGINPPGAPGFGLFDLNYKLPCDSDKDGIPNRLDLDSDNDGCADAVEGGSITDTNPIKLEDLITASGTLTDGNGGVVTKNITTTDVDTNGVPVVVGVTGQSVGGSQKKANFTIAKNLQDRAVCLGETVTFETIINYPSNGSTNLLTVLEESVDGGNTWNVYSGSESYNNSSDTQTTAGISFIPAATDNGKLFRVYVEHENNQCGVYTDEAVLTVYSLDSDGDKVPDFCDLDDDNDGISDIEECSATQLPSVVEPSVDALRWSDSGFDIFVAGGSTDALGFERSGFQKNIVEKKLSYENVNGADDFIVSGVGENAIVSFDNGTITYSDYYPNNVGSVIFGDTTIDNSISGNTGDAIFVRSRLGQTITDSYTVTIDFTNFVKAFSFDMVDIFDTFKNDNPLLRYAIYVDGILTAYMEGYAIGNDIVGSAGIYNKDGVLQGILPSGHNLENTFGFVSDKSFKKITIVHTIISLNGTTQVYRDPHGFDNFTYSVECDTDSDNDSIPNRLDFDSDNDGCSDANEAYNNAQADVDGNGYFGSGNPPAVNSDGTVVGATYPGTNDNVITEGNASVITTQPTDVSVDYGNDAIFTVSLTQGSGTTQYQWQESTDNGVTWNNLSDGGVYTQTTTSTLKLVGVTDVLNGNLYQVVITQSDLVCEVISNSVKLNIKNIIDAVDNIYSSVNGNEGGVVGDITANDTLNGNPVNDNEISITLDNATNTIGATVDSNGNLTIPENTPEGTYILEYTICEVLNPTNCDTASITIEVIAAPIEAVDDTATVTTGGGVIDITANDTLNGSPVDDNEISITLDDATNTIGTTVDSNGNLTIPANTPEGTYVLEYTICEVLNPTNCDTASITIEVIAAPIDTVDDTGTVTTSGGIAVDNVLLNDDFNGSVPTLSEVTISLISTQSPKITLNTQTGAVTVAPNTLAGTYVLVYEICSKFNPTNCSTASVTVVVTLEGDGTVKVNQLFTPNGDGLNDILIQNINDFPDNNVQIFNRWGVKVWETKGYNNQSNTFMGMSNGRATVNKDELLPVGVYYVVMSYTVNGQTKQEVTYFYLNR